MVTGTGGSIPPIKGRDAPTSLATDWSKQAVEISGCCNSGWQTIFVSSKFNTQAASNYYYIEGKVCAANWALQKCTFFIGHPDLDLVIDHKPLLAILGQEQDLTELANPHLMTLKLKTNVFEFTPRYVPRKSHSVPDTMSRHLDSPVHQYPTLPKNPPPVNNEQPQYADSFRQPPPSVSAPIEEELNKGHNATTLAAAGLQLPNGGDNSTKAESMITWLQLKQAS